MLVDPPPSVVTEVFDHGEGLDIDAVAEYNDSVYPEANDIRKASATCRDWIIR